MQREPNPYAQQPVYTVTQTMSISVPSVVAEDVLDGEDMGGGGSSIDSSTLVALQSDMVELKSDVATLETNVSNLIYDIPNVKLNAPLSSIQFFGGSNNVLMQKIAYNNNPSDLQYCTLVVDGIANPEATDCRLRVTSSGTIQTSTNAGSTWTTLSGEGSSDVTLSGSLEKLEFAGRLDQALIAVKGNLDGGTGLSYYSLAARAFADITYAAHQMKPVYDGIAYSNDYGKTWTTITASSGSTSGGGTGSGSTSNVITFGPFGASEQYELSLALDTNYRADSYSAIVDLRDTTNDYPGSAALGAYLAAPAYDSACISGVLMTVSGMGTLIFKHNNETVTYDLNNLEGTGTGSEGGNLQIDSGQFSDEKIFRVKTDTPIFDTTDSAVMSLELYNPAYDTSQLYALAAPWFASSQNNKYGMRIIPTSNYANMLELTMNGGATWSKLPGTTSENGSTAGFVRASFSDAAPVDLNMMVAPGNPYYDMIRLTPSPTDTNLRYHLQTALGAIGASGIPNLEADIAIRTRLALVEANDHTTQPKLKYTYNSGATWYDFKFQLDDSTGNLEIGDYSISVSNMAWLSDNASKLAALLNS